MSTLVFFILMAMLSVFQSRALVPVKATPASEDHAAADAQQASRSQLPPSPVAFDTEILPILSAKCLPCHFTGGKMYAKLPFDNPKTIYMLGDRLFTRIKDEREQASIRAFLAGNTPVPAAVSRTP